MCRVVGGVVGGVLATLSDLVPRGRQLAACKTLGMRLPQAPLAGMLAAAFGCLIDSTVGSESSTAGLPLLAIEWDCH